MAALNLQHRILLGFDQEGDKSQAVLEKLQALGVQRVAYGTGASVCYPNPYLKTIARVANLNAA